VDFTGLVLIATGLGALQVVLDKGQRDEWFTSPFITVLTLLSVCALVAFVWWEWHHKHPIVQLGLFRHRSFAVASVLMMLIFAVLLGSTLLIPQFAQVELRYSAQKAGEVLSPGGFGILLLMPLAGFLVSRVDARYLVAAGFLIFAFAFFHMTNLNAGIDFKTLMWWRVYQAAGMAFLFVPINTIAYTGMAPEASNQVSALTNLMRNIGGSIGISAVTTLLAQRQQVHQAYLAHNIVPSSTHLRDALNGLTAQLSSRTDAAHAMQQAYGRIYRGVRLQASVLAYIDVFWLLGAVCILALGLIFLAKKTKPGARAMAH
jgi:DHA2 family multidrug resistance protein